MQTAEEQRPVRRRNGKHPLVDGDTVLDILGAGSAFLTAISNGAVAVPGLQAAAAVAKEVIAIAQVRLQRDSHSGRSSYSLKSLLDGAQQQGELLGTSAAGRRIHVCDRVRVRC